MPARVVLLASLKKYFPNQYTFFIREVGRDNEELLAALQQET